MKVTYMNGAGNDFMVVDARGQSWDFPRMARELCALTGADGFMAVDYAEDGAAADFRLHFYNSDGSRGEMCGNGARCICRYAYELGIAGEQMRVQTDAGLVLGWRLSEERYRIRLNTPSVVDFSRKPGCCYVELGNPGIPHAVVEIPGLDWAKKEEYRAFARALRFDPAFPKGANANLFCRVGGEAVRILTFERGVEDFTLACGTGSGSVATALWCAGQAPGGRLTLQNPGGELEVEIRGEGGIVRELYLIGPTEIGKVLELP
ncbi:MAG: diaminopimelate epimerase [Firmicutes bacterium]|nr:diaminopimelate epimerase [Bacillota bacterium]